MSLKADGEPGAKQDRTLVERRSERELVVARTFDAPVRIVFEAWTNQELFRRWWVPKASGMTLISCVMDVRVGGGYRLEFGHPAFEKPLAFFGKYIEVEPEARLVWTNEESANGPLTTVTFAEKDAKTMVVLRELYPSKAALDEGMEGTASGAPLQFAQLDELLLSLVR